MSEKKAALERARRKGAITPFPGQALGGFEGGVPDSRDHSPTDGPNQSPANGETKRLDITELDAGKVILQFFAKKDISNACRMLYITASAH